MLAPDQTPIGLLDVNVLIALVDGQHVHHDLAHHWFSPGMPRPDGPPVRSLRTLS